MAAFPGGAFTAEHAGDPERSPWPGGGPVTLRGNSIPMRPAPEPLPEAPQPARNVPREARSAVNEKDQFTGTGPAASTASGHLRPKILHNPAGENPKNPLSATTSGYPQLCITERLDHYQ